MWFKVFLLSVACSFVSGEKALLEPCASTDIECLSKTTEKFLENTHKGIPQYDIKTIDPLDVPTLGTKTDEYTARFTGLKISGLKVQKLSNFKIDKARKSVEITTTVKDFTVTSEVEISTPTDSGSGRFEILADIVATAKYAYSTTTDDKGVEHFTAGPEAIECREFKIHKFGFTSTNTDFSFIKKNQDKWQGELLCAIVENAYSVVIHNIRAAAKILPKSAFFTDEDV